MSKNNFGLKNRIRKMATKSGKCKYCHLVGHVIDKCPTIICKHCRSIGHPNWLCPKNPDAEKSEKSIESPVSPKLRNKNSIYGFESTNSLKGSIGDKQGSIRKNQYGDFKSEFKGKSNNNSSNDIVKISEEEVKIDVINIKYYQKFINAKWGDIVM